MFRLITIALFLSVSGLCASTHASEITYFFTDDQVHVRELKREEEIVFLERSKGTWRNQIVVNRDSFDDLILKMRRGPRLASYSRTGDIVPSCAFYELLHPSTWMHGPAYVRDHAFQSMITISGFIIGLVKKEYFEDIFNGEVMKSLTYVGVSLGLGSLGTVYFPRTFGNIIESTALWLLPLESYNGGVAMSRLYNHGFSWSDLSTLTVAIAGLVLLPMIYGHAKIFYHDNTLNARFTTLLPRDVNFPAPLVRDSKTIRVYGHSSMLNNLGLALPNM